MVCSYLVVAEFKDWLSVAKIWIANPATHLIKIKYSIFINSLKSK